MKARIVALVIACIAGVPNRARAQEPVTPDAVKLADQRFSEALAMMDAKRYAEACALFEESQRLAPGGGTLLNLADCYEALGRLAKAHEVFSEAYEQALSAGNVARQEVAKRRREALVPRLAHVVVTVPEAPPGLTIELDGVELPSTSWAKPTAVDPGAHVLRASAPRRRVREIAVPALAAGATRTIEIPPLEVAPETQAPDGSEASWTQTTDWQSVGAITSAAVGTLATVGGTLFALHSRSKHEESDRYCDGDSCSDPRGVEAMNDAITAGDRATACFVVAGVGLSVAGVLWFVRPFDPDPASTQIGFGLGRVELRKQW